MASYTLEDRLRGMLKELQWSSARISGRTACPVCHAVKMAGHTTRCPLARLLTDVKKAVRQRPPRDRAFAIAKMFRRRLRQEGARLSVRTVEMGMSDWPPEHWYWIEAGGRDKGGSLTLAEREALGRITGTEPGTGTWTARAETVARMLGEG